MYTLPGKNTSVWRDTIKPSEYPQLQNNLPVDVVIIGGGLAGLHAAYMLKEQGKKVAVVEADRVGSGVSGHTTAHITSEHNLIYEYLISTFGMDKAQIYATANEQAIARIAEIVTKEKIDCDFTRATQVLITENKKDVEELKKEFEAAKKLGLPVKYLDSADLPFKTYGAIEYQNQARFHPGKYIQALAKSINNDGSYVFEKSRVLNVEEGEPCVVKTEVGDITATDVIVATHFPILDRGGYFARMQSMRSYVIGVYIDEELPVMYDDTAEPFYYVRNQETDKGMMVIIGGQDHDTGSVSDTMSCYEKVEEYARSHFKVKSIAYHWSSQDNYPYDRVPFIGKYTPQSDHLYVTTGFYGEGMTQSTISGMLLTDMIVGKKNSWSDLYTPFRLTVKEEVPSLMSNGVAIATDEVRTVFDKLQPSDSPEEVKKIKADQSKILKIHGKKTAIYRDEKNELHSVSAECGHQGCALSFNTAEKSWDCPCHGSRFTVDGEILHGPTVRKLPAVNI